jgi:hypothetical protein
MAEFKANDKFLHTDGSIHLIDHVEGAVAFVQVYTDGTLKAEYSTDVSEGVMWDTELAGSLTPLKG